jgi:hypothetical protein
MNIYKSITHKEKSFNDKWIYKSYLFKNNENENLGTVILFKDITSNRPYGITIIKALKPKIGSKMIEIVLNDTPEGILPSEDKYISYSAKKMWNRINKSTIFKSEDFVFEGRAEHEESFLNKKYQIDLKRYYKFIPMTKNDIKDSIKIGSEELLKQNYVGTANFLKNDLSQLLTPLKNKKQSKMKI